MIITDLYFLDVGSIISGEVAIQENLQFIIGDGIEGLIDCPVTPHDVLNLTDHEVYWVDPVVKAYYQNDLSEKSDNSILIL